jgi:hypothetical protein
MRTLTDKNVRRIQEGMPAPSASDVAASVIEVAINPDGYKGKAFVVSGTGLQAVP